MPDTKSVDSSHCREDIVAKAVVTRNQSKKLGTSKPKPLHIEPVPESGIDRQKLIELQKQDNSLDRCFAFAKQHKNSTVPKVVLIGLRLLMVCW